MFDFSIFRSGVQKFQATVGEIAEKIERAKRRREDLRMMPLPKSDVIAILTQWVDGETGKYQQRLSTAIAALRDSHQLSVSPSGPHVRLLDATDHPGVMPSLAHVTSNLLFFLRDPVVQGITKAIESMGDWVEGPPLAQRERELEKLDAEIPRLEAQLAELLNEAQASGIVIDPALLTIGKKQSRA